MKEKNLPVNIYSIKVMREYLEMGYNDFFIQLRGCRSSKFITLGENDNFNILNEIDDTTEVLTAEQIMDEKITNIGKAMMQGNFYCNI